MRNLFTAVTVAFVACVAVVSPPVKSAAAADGGGAAPAPPTPPPAPSPPPAGDCATCLQCVGACTTSYADCQRKCFGQPDVKSQQACAAACQTPFACGQACPCSGCSVPQLPH